MNQTIVKITKQIIKNSKPYRSAYLERLTEAEITGVHRKVLGCSNLAHGFAACSPTDKKRLKNDTTPNIAIISSYNDMLSAHQPFATFPNKIKEALKKSGATAQVAGGVPAMCDGIVQSQPGMELSLFSRDIIAESTAIALAHNMFDGVLYLGVCDKIVPGLLIAALSFGHLPAIFIPAGPMPSGISNSAKQKARQDFARGKIGKKELLLAESASYHSPGTCTFYGTSNSNQMLMEIMGLHLPGSSFVMANTQLREELTKASACHILSLINTKTKTIKGIGRMLNEKSFVNAIIGLLATGGSTNHTIHLIAIARACGIVINWQNFHDLSQVVPLITKLYPNGDADVNEFHEAGGMPIIIKELLTNGLLHDEVTTIMGKGLSGHYTKTPILDNKQLLWVEATPFKSNSIISKVSNPFNKQGGISMLSGNIGKSIIKTSALNPKHQFIKAPAEVFDSQQEFKKAYNKGLLNKDFVAIVRYQGPKANGMPELHGLMPILGALQDQGFKVGLITDGRLSGASGKVISAIHITPEAYVGGTIAKIYSGDMIVIDVHKCCVEVLVDELTFNQRIPTLPNISKHRYGMGRELFNIQRASINDATQGACLFDLPTSN